MSDGDKPARGSNEPYGPPIWQAINRGDLHEMEAVAAAAKRALYHVEFSPVTDENRREVQSALAELEKKIAELKRPYG